MRKKPIFTHSPIVTGLVAVMLLSGCQSVFNSGLSKDEQIKFDMLDSNVAAQTQLIESLESNIVNLSEKNGQMGREVVHLREEMALLIEEVKLVKITAEKASKSSMHARGDIAIHLASYRNMETTIKGWRTFSEKYSQEFSNLAGIVSIFTSGSGDNFYRLKAGPFVSQKDALEFCKVLEAKNDYCNVDKFEGDILD
jgi:hypothetical protein